MPRTVSASEAKNQFGSIIDWADERQEEVIVESRGRPKRDSLVLDRVAGLRIVTPRELVLALGGEAVL